MSVNKVILVGNLGADPEQRETGSGVAVCNLRIATSERKKDPAGEWVDHTEWHRVCCFGRTAENCGRYLSKGRLVYVEGKIRTRKWTDNDGRDRWSTEVIGDVVRFLGGGARDDATAVGYRDDIHDVARNVSGAPLDKRPARGRQSDPVDSVARRPPPGRGGTDDDLPF